jgi:plasmid replication initiation protein
MLQHSSRLSDVSLDVERRARDDAECRPVKFELVLAQRFGEQVGSVVVGRYVFELDVSDCSALTDKELSDVKMFRATVVSRRASREAYPHVPDASLQVCTLA